MMKKKMIVGIALAMGILSVGALSASAATSCCNDGKCSGTQAYQGFTKETAALSHALKAKDRELRALYLADGIDIRKADALEAELKELKDKILAAGEKYEIPACCRNQG